MEQKKARERKINMQEWNKRVRTEQKVKWMKQLHDKYFYVQ